ncbi:hypothetical protein RJ639_030417 [Escallonia herrerae]|uniref:Growth-regulating factor n=1 Tax=Escallonia herrerae TaxID=1293975 RepID=A0AA88XFF9_9ASTE|nr:hypothetical protein RJ639_030417 [Escallonia herrerae]
MSGSASSVTAVGEGIRPPFTAVQWQELEHQALIYKYLVAGMPVPPDLVVPIRRSLEALSASCPPFGMFALSAGYCSYYGKKFDPEPGRCRRTDGKKWRCSKDAYLDSKYCERHMHRGRNRSRKPVESQSTSQSLSTAMSHIATGSSSGSGSFQSSGSGSGSFQNLPLYSIGNSEALCFGSNVSKLQMEAVPYGINTKEYRRIFTQFGRTLTGKYTIVPVMEALSKMLSRTVEDLFVRESGELVGYIGCAEKGQLSCSMAENQPEQMQDYTFGRSRGLGAVRYFHGLTPDADEHNYSTESSGGSVSGLGMDSNIEGTWRLLPSPLLKPRNDSYLQGSSTQVQMPQNFVPINDAAMSKQRQQHCFFGSELGSPGPVKQEQHSMRPFFDEWPKTRESWCDVDEDRSNKNAYSTTQLSMSIPRTSSEYSTKSACSPHVLMPKMQ